MQQAINRVKQWLWAPPTLGVVAAGYCAHQDLLVGAGLVTLIYETYHYGCAPFGFIGTAKTLAANPAPPGLSIENHDRLRPASAESLVEQLLRQQRYALLMRPEILLNLSPEQADAARTALNERMALVPLGEIRVGTEVVHQSLRSRAGADDSDGVVVRVNPFLLDRYCVTNQQFKNFVDAGGYGEMPLWDPQIWPGILDFVDQTGSPGPLFWKNGRFPDGQENHPVVGICWYEAAAYARWCGKRLPSGPEWEKAASWPAQLAAVQAAQRRFPWGDSFDPSQANVWLSGLGHTVPVDDFAGGVSTGGIYQLVGNVWEWTSSTYGAFTFMQDEVVAPALLKSVRGGAFDTYFETHATCQFESGEDPTARLHNVGFRCALSLCDVCLDAPEPAADEDAHPRIPHAEEEVAA